MKLHVTFLTVLSCVTSLCLPAFAGPAAEPIAVRIEIDGRAFVGELAAEQPASQPAEPEIPTVTMTGGAAPFAVHLTADEDLDPTTLRETRVRWDFGDPAGRFDQLDGYNAAHVYDAPGTYTITRTIERPTGTSAVRVVLEVTPAQRTTIHVSADGDDRADGAIPERAVRTWSRALAAVGPNVEIRFRRGDTFVVDRAANIRADDVRLTSYGDPAQPRPVLSVERRIGVLIESSGRQLLVDDLTFDATYFGTDLGKANLPDLFRPTGSGNLVVRRCEFRNVNSVVNGNGRPRGVALIDNELPLETGLRSYLAWIEGSNWTILGNRASNSTREHIVRVGGGERINIQHNDFTNLDRTTATTRPDRHDQAKAALNIQKGQVLYVAHNRLRGANGVGPLGKADGLTDTGARWVGAVVEHNRIDGFLEVKHGASFITYRNNLIRADNAIALPIDGFDRQYDRGVSDLWVEHNAVVNGGTAGSFIAVQAGATGIRLVGNLYVAPNLAPGSHQTAAVYVSEPDLRAFAQVGGNVWPTGRPIGWAQHGIHYVAPTWGEQAGYRDPAEWNAMQPPVAGDRFENVADLSVVESDGAGLMNPAVLPAATEHSR